MDSNGRAHSWEGMPTRCADKQPFKPGAGRILCRQYRIAKVAADLGTRDKAMNRDMDLARQILEQVEEKSQGLGAVHLDLPGRVQKEISYHVMLLNQAGLLKATDVSNSETGLAWLPISLTYQGHEFLDAIRNDTVWKKVKETVKEKGGSIPFEILKALALKFAGSVFGIGG
jgi:hypothetical protein